MPRGKFCEVQAGSTHANHDLVVAWCWIRLLLALEHVNVAVCSCYDLSHRPILSVMIRAISVNLFRQYAHTTCHPPLTAGRELHFTAISKPTDRGRDLGRGRRGAQ